MGFYLSNDEEICKIKRDIEKSGLPLEIEVGTTLNEKGWDVGHQAYYLDPDENKSRFIDIVADKTVKTSSTKKTVWQILVIECKRSLDKPWVFYTTPHAKNTININCLKFVAQHKLTEGEHALLRCSHCFLEDPKEAAIINYEPFIGKGESKFFTAVNQTLKALRYGVNAEIIPLLKTRQQEDIIAIFYPVIVFDGRMYKCEKLKGGDLELSPINYVQYKASYRGSFAPKPPPHPPI